MSADREKGAVAYLVDASPYIFRAYFALPSSIVDPQGRPVHAVHGFGGFLLRLLSEEEPSHLAVTFDGSLTTSFRNEIYPQYKASRDRPDPELEAQLDDCRELARALGMTTFIDRRYEADDLVGTVCHRLVSAGHSAVLVTGDKDFAQLVGPRVTLYDFAKGERWDSERVKAKFGVRPAQIADLLALAGDSVDDIPGVQGIGAKTAVALLDAFDDLEAIYDGLAMIERMPLRGAAAIARKLEAGREAAFLSRRLATIARDAPAEAGLDEIAWTGAERRATEALCERLGFESLVDRVPRWR